MKKYSDKFLNQYTKLKDSVVGIEFEFYTKELSYYKTLEMLNEELSPVRVHGFRQYHSDFKPDKNNHKLEPDLSGGSSMCEYITGPMEYQEAKYYLIKILKFIQKNGYTSDKSSIHFNVSFTGDKNLNDLNVLKLILNTDEDEIYRCYPSRKGNVYAKSVKTIIPYKEYDFFNIPIGVIKNNLRLTKDKYYGINFLNMNNDKETQRLEFRYIGGKDYEKNIGQLIYFMDRFIIDIYDSIDFDFNSNDIIKLEEYLENNISRFKTLSKYDNLIIDYPNIQLQIDQIGEYTLVSSYYGKIYNKLFNIIDSTDNLDECIINYITSTQVMEVVDANIKSTSTISNYEFINCKIEGIIENSFLVGCEVTSSQISKSRLEHCDVSKSKILGCRVESSTLKDCYLMEGYLNSDMFSGVFRSGKLGPHATLDSEVKIVTDTDNFFDTKFDEVEQKGTDKGVLKGYGKINKI